MDLIYKQIKFFLFIFWALQKYCSVESRFRPSTAINIEFMSVDQFNWSQPQVEQHDLFLAYECILRFEWITQAVH